MDGEGICKKGSIPHNSLDGGSYGKNLQTLDVHGESE